MSSSSKSKAAFRSHVASSSIAQLRRELTNLFAAFPEVRQYFDARLLASGEKAALLQAKAGITQEFFPARGFGKARPSISREIISSFGRLSPSPESMVDLLLHHTETGVSYTNDFGDINETFYSSVEVSFLRALKMLGTEELKQQFRARCEAVVKDSEGIGWGFHDTLADSFYRVF